jgi:hypothetical protein
MGDLDLDEIAEELTLSTKKWAADRSSFLRETYEIIDFGVEDVERCADELGLGERPNIEIYLPSREEIRLAAAAIRAGWTQEEREARLRNAWIGTLKDATGGDNDAGGSASPDCAERDSADAQSWRQDRRG